MGITVLERNQPKGVKQKMRGRKLRSCGSWQWALKQKGVKHVECRKRATCTRCC